MNKIKTIAHRGLCNIFPQCSLPSISAALYQADLVEFDIHLTKDNQLVVFHDKGLTRMIDSRSLITLKQNNQHQSKFYKADYQLPGQYCEDFWLKQFTLQELREFKLKQPFKNRPQYLNHQLSLKIPTLEEVIQLGLNEKSRQEMKRKSQFPGFLIQIKTQQFDKYSQRDYIMIKQLVRILQKYQLTSYQKCLKKNLPIYIGSFCNKSLSVLDSQINIPLVHFFYLQKVNEQLLNKQVTSLVNSKAIGITYWHLQQSNLIQVCREKGLEVFYWTVIDDDNQDIQGKLPFNCKTYKEIYQKLKNIGISGIITQFPSKCKVIIE